MIALRASQADPRERHRGLSHHARDVLRLAGAEAVAAWPRGFDQPDAAEVEEVDVTGWQEACSELPLAHMGRTPDDDPLFFAAAFAAGRLARQRLG